MNIQRLLTCAGLLLSVLLVQRPILAAASCDPLADPECAAGTLSTIADKAADVELQVKDFKTTLERLEGPRANVIFSLVNRLGSKAGQMQTFADVTLANLLSDQDENIVTVAFRVMDAATSDIESDVKEILSEIQAMNTAKDALQDATEHNEEVANSFADVIASITDLMAAVRCPVCEG